MAWVPTSLLRQGPPTFSRFIHPHPTCRHTKNVSQCAIPNDVLTTHNIVWGQIPQPSPHSLPSLDTVPSYPITVSGSAVAINIVRLTRSRRVSFRLRSLFPPLSPRPLVLRGPEKVPRGRENTILSGQQEKRATLTRGSTRVAGV